MCILQRQPPFVKWANQKNCSRYKRPIHRWRPSKKALPTLTNMPNRGMVYLEKYTQMSVLCKMPLEEAQSKSQFFRNYRRTCLLFTWQVVAK